MPTLKHFKGWRPSMYTETKLRSTSLKGAGKKGSDDGAPAPSK